MQDGNEWVLNGEKLWCTNGREADIIIVFATIDPELKGKGICAFIVEADTPGFTVGKREDTLGIRTVFLSAEGDDVARIYRRVGFTDVGTVCAAELPSPTG